LNEDLENLKKNEVKDEVKEEEVNHNQVEGIGEGKEVLKGTKRRLRMTLSELKIEGSEWKKEFDWT